MRMSGEHPRALAAFRLGRWASGLMSAIVMSCRRRLARVPVRSVFDLDTAADVLALNSGSAHRASNRPFAYDRCSSRWAPFVIRDRLPGELLSLLKSM